MILKIVPVSGTNPRVTVYDEDGAVVGDASYPLSQIEGELYGATIPIEEVPLGAYTVKSLNDAVTLGWFAMQVVDNVEPLTGTEAELYDILQNTINIEAKIDIIDTLVDDLPTNAELTTALDPLPTISEMRALFLRTGAIASTVETQPQNVDWRITATTDETLTSKIDFAMHQCGMDDLTFVGNAPPSGASCSISAGTLTIIIRASILDDYSVNETITYDVRAVDSPDTDLITSGSIVLSEGIGTRTA